MFFDGRCEGCETSEKTPTQFAIVAINEKLIICIFNIIRPDCQPMFHYKLAFCKLAVDVCGDRSTRLKRYY